MRKVSRGISSAVMSFLLAGLLFSVGALAEDPAEYIHSQQASWDRFCSANPEKCEAIRDRSLFDADRSIGDNLSEQRTLLFDDKIEIDTRAHLASLMRYHQDAKETIFKDLLYWATNDHHGSDWNISAALASYLVEGGTSFIETFEEVLNQTWAQNSLVKSGVVMTRVLLAGLHQDRSNDQLWDLLGRWVPRFAKDRLCTLDSTSLSVAAAAITATACRRSEDTPTWTELAQRYDLNDQDAVLRATAAVAQQLGGEKLLSSLSPGMFGSGDWSSTEPITTKIWHDLIGVRPESTYPQQWASLTKLEGSCEDLLR